MADNILKTSFFRHWLVPHLAYWLTRVNLATCRIVYHNLDNMRVYREREDAGENIIFGSWHGRGMLLPAIYRHNFGYDKLTMMVSPSKDGDMLAGYFNLLGVDCVRGSARKNPVGALKSMLRITRGGRDTAMALDGSRGPLQRIEPGVLLISQRSGAPIIPLAVSARLSIRASSWDHCMLILPFARIHIVFGEPFVVPREAQDLEPYCEKLQAIMDEITLQGDAFAGIRPDEKGPERPKKESK